MDFTAAKLFDYGLAGAALLLVAQFHWHAVRRTIPGLLAAFRSELAAQRGEQRDDREQRDRHMTALIGSLDALGSRVDRIETDLAEVRTALGTRPLRVFRPDDHDPAA